jgi:hypothetical protein
MKIKTNKTRKSPKRGRGRMLLQLNGDKCALRLRRFDKKGAPDYVLSVIEECEGTGKSVATFRMTERRALVLANALAGPKPITVEETAQ